MIIVCSRCAARFESLIVVRERAIADISKLITNHWTIKHKQEMKTIAEGIMTAQLAFAWYLTINSLCFIPTEETILVAEKEKALDLTMAALGYDDDDEEDDEDNEEDDDNNDDDTAEREIETNPLETDSNSPGITSKDHVGSIGEPQLVP